MSDTRARAEIYLRKALKSDTASFRDGQWECIEALLSGKHVLVVQRTGWGKSMVYFIATRLLRDRKSGPTFLISPLLSLMRNQIEAAASIGLRARTINSSNPEEYQDICAEYRKNSIDLLLISPERLSNTDFQKDFLEEASNSMGMLVVDEAHCISDWGHDFRPDYRRIVRIVKAMPTNVPILATTATANDRVVEDIEEQMGHDLIIQRGSLLRASLYLQNISLPGQAERLAWLAHSIPKLKGSGIVYVLTKRDAETVSNWLRANGINARAYHAGNELNEERTNLEQALLDNAVKVLVATVALGMGFDKPDLGFVIHYQRPASVVHYYQQVGRAGRGLKNAYGILLCGEEDEQITNYFIENAFPPQTHIDAILTVLRNSEGVSLSDIEARINLSRGKILAAIRYMSVESPSPLVKIGNKYLATPTASKYTIDDERVKKITALRREEQAQTHSYMESKTCLMEFMQAALDDKNASPCRKCMNCRPSAALDSTCPLDLVEKAHSFLKSRFIPIEPRKQWPTANIFKQYPFAQKNIPPELRAEEGRALCVYADAGWGTLVRDGKYRLGVFDQKLVFACADLYRRWEFNSVPEWIACIPSLIHPELVPDFTKRLALELNLPFVPCLYKLRSNKPQKSLENSYQQVKNLDGVFAVDTVPSGPCLLIDDMVDSRWTFTVAAALLRLAGCAEVYPLALALTSGNA